MSTKTLRKRIALATVVALGAGVLSLVSTTAANATNNSAVGSAGPAAAVDVLNIGTATNTTGSAVIPATSGTGATASSVGLVNVSSIAGDLTAGLTQTAVMLPTGKLVVYTSSTTVSKNYTIVVSGGTLSANTSSSLVTSIAGDLTSVASASAGIGLLAVQVAPNSGATSMVVSLYDNGSTAASTSSPTAGTLYGQINVTIAATSTAGAVSTAKSGVWYAHTNFGGVASLTADDTTTATEANPTGGTGAYGVIQYANIRLRDAYGTAITNSTSGLLSATATNGAYVSIGAVTTAATPTTSSAYTTGNGGAFDNSFLAVKNPGSGPLQTVVTVSYNGTVIGTKSFTFTGQIAKITLSAASNGTTGSTATSTIAFADAAGNAVYPTSGSSNYPTANVATDGDTLNAYVLSGAVGVNGATSLWPTSSSAGVYEWTCVSSAVGAGSANVGVRYTNNDGTVIKSNALKVTCSGTAHTYTAALDKATYAPGDIAKLTVTFKDSKGNLAADGSTIASSTYKPSLSGGNLTLIGGTDAATGLATDATSNGAVTYKFTVGAPTVDPYGGQLVVSFGAVNNADQGAVTVGYKIASGSTSLNDVLKGIVSLIASINKQIAALAKLVTKKK
jgi:hypothetical protein